MKYGEIIYFKQNIKFLHIFSFLYLLIQNEFKLIKTKSKKGTIKMTNKKRKTTQLGSFMCKLLRHNPKEFNLEIDEYGYCELNDLLMTIQTQEYWSQTTMEEIKEIVKTCNKQRYTINGTRIKTNYGHSIPVIQEKKERDIPEYLYHGTNKKALEKIIDKREGVKPMTRQFVHLSETNSFAELAAKRRPEPLLIKVNVKVAIDLGVEFYYAGNEVWLSTHIPAEAIYNNGQ